MNKELKAYIVGINFNKYTLLNKINTYLLDECKFNVEYVEWLGKKNIDKKQYEDGSIYIYVEVDNIYKIAPYMIIEADEDKKSIANKFKVLLTDIDKLMLSKIEEQDKITEATKEPEYISDDNLLTGAITSSEDSICVDNHIVEDNDNKIIEEASFDVPIVIATTRISSLVGINVVIDNKEYYVSKEDFIQLYELDNMLSNHGYKLSSIVVSDETNS